MIRTLYLETRPVGKERARSGRYGNHYTPSATKQAEHEIRQAWLRKHSDQRVVQGHAVGVVVAARLPRPKSHYGTGRNAGLLKASAPSLHTSKPDLDNLAKMILDALNGTAYYDDSHVSDFRISKEYAASDQGWHIQVHDLEP